MAGVHGSHSPQRFLNREISWLEFNRRVLEEAESERHPLLERVKFLSIFHSNLDEFFMIRVSGLQEQVDSGLVEPSKDGLTPAEQLAIVRQRSAELRQLAWECYEQMLLPALHSAGIHIVNYGETDDAERRRLSEYFERQVYPTLTPLAVDPSHPFPLISNLSMNLAVVVKGSDRQAKFARVKIPQSLPRLIGTADGSAGSDEASAQSARARTSGRRRARALRLVWLEDVIAAHVGSLFPGMEVMSSHPFRVIRDADMEIREDEAGDLLQGIESVLRRRRFGSVTQLEVHASIPPDVSSLLIGNLEISAADCFRTPGILGLSDLMQLMECDRPDLKDRPYRPRRPARLPTSGDLFTAIRERDILLHHPYDDFTPVVDFINAAANDPEVLAIKQTIYRVGAGSPVVAALRDACEKGKQVSVIVELKARFDEENNLEWARALEASGVHVVYSDILFKVHCKLLMVVRREGERVTRYIHMGTGNYNAKTARLYTDFGLFTCDTEIADDLSLLFNALTGYSEHQAYKKLLVSPKGIRRGLVERIDREIEWARKGQTARLVFKMNSLTDFDCAAKLYEASQAGVKIDLIVRGSCCLIPGVQGMSENINVRSVVGRFLEHDRVYYFRNGGNDEEVCLGSADLMPRNLDRRYEVLFPVDDESLRRWLIDEYLETYMLDDTTARVLGPDGDYSRLTPSGGQGLNVQTWFMAHSRADGPMRTSAGRAKRTGSGRSAPPPMVN